MVYISSVQLGLFSLKDVALRLFNSVCLFYICLSLVRSALEPGRASRVTLRHALFYFCNTRFPSLPCLVLCSQGHGEVEAAVRSGQLPWKELLPIKSQEIIPGCGNPERCEALSSISTLCATSPDPKLQL